MSPVGGTVFLNELTRLGTATVRIGLEDCPRRARSECASREPAEDRGAAASRRARVDGTQVGIPRRDRRWPGRSSQWSPATALSRRCVSCQTAPWSLRVRSSRCWERPISNASCSTGPSRVIDIGQAPPLLHRRTSTCDRSARSPLPTSVGLRRAGRACARVDHIVPHSRGGLTTQENGRCYCKTHNGRKADQLDGARGSRCRSDDQDPPDDG